MEVQANRRRLYHSAGGVTVAVRADDYALADIWICEREVKRLDGFVGIVSNENFQTELGILKEHVQNRRKAGRGKNDIIYFLIGYVTAPTIKAYTTDQLRQIFDLADEEAGEVSS